MPPASSTTASSRITSTVMAATSPNVLFVSSWVRSDSMVRRLLCTRKIWAGILRLNCEIRCNSCAVCCMRALNIVLISRTN